MLHASHAVARRRKPTIAVTGPDRGGLVAWLFARRAILKAGGRPIRIRPARPHPDLVIDGLVVGGGADVNPQAYGEEPVTKPEVERLSRSMGWAHMVLGFLVAPLIYLLRRLFSRKSRGVSDLTRDDLELAFLDRAANGDLPVLGICRGAQLMNVHQGGTLHRDLANFYTERQALWTVLPRKEVEIQAGSTLAGTIGLSRCWVNSLHRQAVADVGDSLRISARDQSGVVQAIEHIDRRFWMGVQWHPEYMPQQREQRRLFETLVETAREQAVERERKGPVEHASSFVRDRTVGAG